MTSFDGPVFVRETVSLLLTPERRVHVIVSPSNISIDNTGRGTAARIGIGVAVMGIIKGGGVVVTTGEVIVAAAAKVDIEISTGTTLSLLQSHPPKHKHLHRHWFITGTKTWSKATLR